MKHVVRCRSYSGSMPITSLCRSLFDVVRVGDARRVGVVLIALAGLGAVLETLWCQSASAQTLDMSAGLDASIIAEFGGDKTVTRPVHDAIMGFSLPTTITEVLVKGGQEVSKGTVLVRGDEAEDQALLKLQKLRAESDTVVQSAKAGMELADVEHRQLVEVYEKGGSSQQEVERARLTFERARLEFESAKEQRAQEVIQLERLRARVDRLRLVAPYDGVVDTVLCDLGQAVEANEKLLRVVTIDILEMDVPAPADDPVTLGLKQGDKAWILLAVARAPRLVEGTVVETSPTLDLASRSRRIRVEFANPEGVDRVLPGGPAWVRFKEPSQKATDKIRAASTAAAATQDRRAELTEASR
jgi:RND family efflux transporter MFP subunit